MNIDSIINGIVIDHIPAGRSMRIYQLLGLDRLDCPVAIIKNANSAQMGKKDIIKVDADIDVNLDIIGFVAPNATVNIIRDGKLVEKGVYVKMARGEMVRYMAEQNVQEPESMKNFTGLGYGFSQEHSTEELFTFVR